jgi:endonuclease YncB( thermonuclease family)
MIKIIIILLLLISRAYGDDFHDVEFVKNYDGDTITVNLACDIPLFCDNVKVRVDGIDTPEIRTKSKCEALKALEAKAFVNYRLSKASSVSLLNCKRGKYFRLVCDVSTPRGDLSYALMGLK